MLIVKNEIELHAPPWRVWKVLTNLDGYDRWHPFIKTGGEPTLGAEVDYIFRHRAFQDHFTAAATIIRCEETNRFGWRIGLGSFLSFDETFDIEANEQGSTLRHSITGNGLLAFLPTRLVAKRLHDLIFRTDQALERHLRGAGSPPARPGNRRKRRIAESRARHTPSKRGGNG